jgi:Putative Actinobacterial Holin-X, holin superfamily III
VTSSHHSSSATPNGRHAAEPSVGGASEPSVGQLVSDATTHFSTLVHSEIELAKLEVRSAVKNAGTGAGFFAAAGVLLVFSLTFGFIALAEGLVAAGLWRWLAYLIVFGAFLIVVVILALLGIRKVKKVHGPQKTIETSKDTVAYLKANTRRG